MWSYPSGASEAAQRELRRRIRMLCHDGRLTSSLASFIFFSPRLSPLSVCTAQVFGDVRVAEGDLAAAASVGVDPGAVHSLRLDVPMGLHQPLLRPGVLLLAQALARQHVAVRGAADLHPLRHLLAARHHRLRLLLAQGGDGGWVQVHRRGWSVAHCAHTPHRVARKSKGVDSSRGTAGFAPSRSAVTHAWAHGRSFLCFCFFVDSFVLPFLCFFLCV